jgi:hypothetical protein
MMIVTLRNSRQSHSSKQADYLSNFAGADACDVSDAARVCAQLASPIT